MHRVGYGDVAGLKVLNVCNCKVTTDGSMYVRALQTICVNRRVPLAYFLEQHAESLNWWIMQTFVFAHVKATRSMAVVLSGNKVVLWMCAGLHALYLNASCDDKARVFHLLQFAGPVCNSERWTFSSNVSTPLTRHHMHYIALNVTSVLHRTYTMFVASFKKIIIGYDQY